VARRPACSSSTSNSSPSAEAPAPGRSFAADRGDEARRLDLAVLRRAALHGLSRSRVQRLVADGRVLVNGAPVRRPSQRLHGGDVVTLDVAPPRPRTRPAGEALPLDIRYEDDDLIVVNKPPGQVVHPSFKHGSGTLMNALLWHAARALPPWQPHLLQRLDKGTSGLLVVAKSAPALAALQHDAMVKEYLALVWGRPTPLAGRIETRLGRSPLDRRRVVASTHGAEAVTEYRTLARSRRAARGVTLLACRLVTGRTHQLRVHLADRGWPLVGDPVYRAVRPARIEDPQLHRAAASFQRQALHAWRIRIERAHRGASVAVEAEPPRDLQALLEDLAIRVPESKGATASSDQRPDAGRTR
jgi:23S rRNA pseudouridine1911/1915/1917 synthase